MTDYTTELIKLYQGKNDYTAELIKCYLNDKDYVAEGDHPTIDCWEMSDWIEEMCQTQNINAYAKRYIDFTQMLLDDDDFQIFVRREDGTFQNIGYFITSRRDWGKAAKEWIDDSPRNAVFVVRAN